MVVSIWNFLWVSVLCIDWPGDSDNDGHAILYILIQWMMEKTPRIITVAFFMSILRLIQNHSTICLQNHSAIGLHGMFQSIVPN